MPRFTAPPPLVQHPEPSVMERRSGTRPAAAYLSTRAVNPHRCQQWFRGAAAVQSSTTVACHAHHLAGAKLAASFFILPPQCTNKQTHQTGSPCCQKRLQQPPAKHSSHTRQGPPHSSFTALGIAAAKAACSRNMVKPTGMWALSTDGLREIRTPCIIVRVHSHVQSPLAGYDARNDSGLGAISITHRPIIQCPGTCNLSLTSTQKPEAPHIDQPNAQTVCHTHATIQNAAQDLQENLT
jgi:hypothetical protein